MPAASVFHALDLPGCFEWSPNPLQDRRGTFIKSYREDLFAEQGLRTDWREEFFTTSRRGVIRGLHFQVPPAQHAKLVTCMAGAALDVLLDLRPGPSYGRWISLSLSGKEGNAVYVPEGLAHGFQALAEDTILHYKTTSLHAPDHDRGIRWDSFGCPWPLPDPILSDRDRAFTGLDEFQSPFRS